MMNEQTNRATKEPTNQPTAYRGTNNQRVRQKRDEGMNKGTNERIYQQKKGQTNYIMVGYTGVYKLFYT